MNARRDHDDLLYNRQFIAGPRPFQPLQTWQEVPFDGVGFICAHPNLRLSTFALDGCEALCLGQMIDPREPSDGGRRVLERTLKLVSSFEAFEKVAAELGGRWLVFLRIGSETRLYPDACGQRPSSYTTTGAGEVWIASQPQLLAEAAQVSIDEALLDRFLSHKFASSWTGTVTPYRDVRQLLPNHFLSLPSARAERFWPRSTIPRLDLDDAASDMGRILRGTLQASVQEGPVAQPVTGGHDSRVLFACTEGLRDRISFFTVVDPATPSYDVAIPQALAKAHGARFQVIRARPSPPEFKETYSRNTGYMYWSPGRIKVYSFGQAFPDHILNNGLCGEVLRCFYYKDGRPPLELDGRKLAQLAGYDGNPVAIESFAQWLSEVPSESGIDLLDLFYWEHRLGNWGALSSTSVDTVCRVLTPFNCRKLLEIGLGVDASYRRRPYRLFRRICEIESPRTLDFPFNARHKSLSRGLRLPERMERLASLAVRPAVLRLTGLHWRPAYRPPPS